MDRRLIIDACSLATTLRPVPAARASAIAARYPWLYYTNVDEYMSARVMKRPNAAADALAYGMSPYLISDDALFRNVSPFFMVNAIGTQPLLILRKWRSPDQLISLMLDLGPILVPPNILLAWQ